MKLPYRNNLSPFPLFPTFVLFVLVYSGFLVDIFAESKIAFIIKIEGKKGAGNDFYLIGGKNCDTPTLIKKGKGKNKYKRGKIIIIEKECQSSYDEQPMHRIPVYMPAYHQYHSSGY